MLALSGEFIDESGQIKDIVKSNKGGIYVININLTSIININQYLYSWYL